MKYYSIKKIKYLFKKLNQPDRTRLAVVGIFYLSLRSLILLLDPEHPVQNYGQDNNSQAGLKPHAYIDDRK